MSALTIIDRDLARKEATGNKFAKEIRQARDAVAELFEALGKMPTMEVRIGCTCRECESKRRLAAAYTRFKRAGGAA
jgi:hypothetical protein